MTGGHVPAAAICTKPGWLHGASSWVGAHPVQDQVVHLPRGQIVGPAQCPGAQLCGHLASASIASCVRKMVTGFQLGTCVCFHSAKVDSLNGLCCPVAAASPSARPWVTRVPGARVADGPPGLIWRVMAEVGPAPRAQARRGQPAPDALLGCSRVIGGTWPFTQHVGPVPCSRADSGRIRRRPELGPPIETAQGIDTRVVAPLPQH